MQKQALRATIHIHAFTERSRSFSAGFMSAGDKEKARKKQQIDQLSILQRMQVHTYKHLGQLPKIDTKGKLEH